MNKDYYPGKGGCLGVDWTDPDIYKFENEKKKLKSIINTLVDELELLNNKKHFARYEYDKKIIKEAREAIK